MEKHFLNVNCFWDILAQNDSTVGFFKGLIEGQLLRSYKLRRSTGTEKLVTVRACNIIVGNAGFPLELG